MWVGEGEGLGRGRHCHGRWVGEFERWGGIQEGRGRGRGGGEVRVGRIGLNCSGWGRGAHFVKKKAI